MLWKAQELQGLVERDRLGSHRCEKRCPLGLLLRALLLLAELHVRTEPAGQHEHGQAAFGVVPQIRGPSDCFAINRACTRP